MRNRRFGERGEGRLGLLVALALLGMGIFLGVKILPVRINAYEFKDFISEECRFGASKNTDAMIYKRIYEKARELEIPLEKKNLVLERTTSNLIIRARYEQPIDLKFTKYVFRFNETVQYQAF